MVEVPRTKRLLGLDAAVITLMAHDAALALGVRMFCCSISANEFFKIWNWTG